VEGVGKVHPSRKGVREWLGGTSNRVYLTLWEKIIRSVKKHEGIQGTIPRERKHRKGTIFQIMKTNSGKVGGKRTGRGKRSSDKD